MAFHIQKPAALGTGTVYFAGGSRWTDDVSESQSYPTEAAATAATQGTSTVITGTRTGVGFKGATVVSI